MSKIAKTILALIVFLLPLLTNAQDKTISGKVTDETGAGIPDVSVAVKGSNTTTKTNTTGNFVINIPAGFTNGELVFTHVNYAEASAKISGSNVSTTLQKVTKDLDEVVVIGYGTQKRKNVTGAVSSFDA